MRKPARTLVTTGAMALSAGVMIFFGAIVIGYIEQMKTSALAMETAEAQIHAKGYRDEPDLHTYMRDSAAIADKLRQSGMHVTERLYGFALAAHEKQSSGVMMRGIDLVNEPKVTSLHTAVWKGKWLDAKDLRGVVIGKKLARRLGIAVGGEIVVLSQAADGSMADDLLTVRGIFRSVSARVDNASIIMNAVAFRELMAIPTGAHEMAVMRAGGFGAEVSGLKKQLKAVTADHDVQTWPELQPMLAEMMKTSDLQIGFMLFIAYLAVVTVVFNATLMSVFERMREFGILKALGVAPRQIFIVVIIESGFQAVLAAIVALAGGLGLTWLLRDGLDISGGGSSEMTFSGMSVTPLIVPQLSTFVVVAPVVLLVIMVILAAVYPGIKAALVRPITAIRGS